MLGTDFNNYQNILKKEKITRNPLEYCFEDSSKFILLFKDANNSEIYTIVQKSTITAFAESESQDSEFALDQFRINYCFNARVINAINELSVSTQEELVLNSKEELVLNASFNKSVDVDVVDEAKDYEDFFTKTVDKWKNQVISRIDEVPIEKMYSSEIEKGFGEFIRGLFNTVNTLPFMKTLRKYIKKSMVEGITSAEEEVGVDIGWSENFNKTLKLLETEQIEGYNIHGKPWYGIKGATKELQFNILKQVEEDIRNKVGKKEMTENIKNIFDGATTAQAKRIARTETTRFVNMAKLQGFKESGIPGKKAWDAVNDGKTRPTHREMSEIYKNGIPFDDEFIEPGTGKSVQHPPLDPNCRCVIKYVFSK